MKKIYILLASICFIILSSYNASAQYNAFPDTSICITGSPIQLRSVRPSVGLVPGIPNFDDAFSGIVPIGFPFTFYGNTYNSCVLSTNNLISFNLANANSFSSWGISNRLPTTVPNDITNAILGPWHDLNPNLGGVMGYTTIGVAPNRIFIYGMCNVPMFNCNNLSYSGHIRLYESTNVIEVHMANKQICGTWNNGRALLGLNNSTGTVADTPTVFSQLSSWNASNLAFRFTPVVGGTYSITNIPFLGLPVNFISYQWIDDNGVVIANNIDPIVNPTRSTKYILRTNTCDGVVYDTAQVDICCLDAVTLSMNNSYCWDDQLNTNFNLNGNVVTGYRYVIHELPPGGPWSAVWFGPYLSGAPASSINLQSLWNGFQPGKEYCVSIDLFNNCFSGSINRTIVSCFKIKPKYGRKQTINFSCTDSCKTVTLLKTPTMPLTAAISGWTNTATSKTKSFCPTDAYTQIIVPSIDSGGCNAYDTIILIKDTCCLDKVTLTMPATLCWDANFLATFSTGINKVTSYRILIHEVPPGGTWFAVYTGPYTNGTPPTSINLRSYYSGFQPGKEYCISIDLFKDCTGGGTINRTVVACFKIKPKYGRKQIINFTCTDNCKTVTLLKTPSMPLTAAIAGWTNTATSKTKSFCPTIPYTQIIVPSIDSGGCNAYDTIILIKDTCCLDKVTLTMPATLCWDANFLATFSTGINNVTSYRILIHEVPPGGTWFAVYTGPYTNGTPPSSINLRSYYSGFQPGKEYCISIDLFKDCTGGGTINRTVVACFKIKPKNERKQTIYFSCTDNCKTVTLLKTPSMPLTAAISGWTNTATSKTKSYCPTIPYTQIIVPSIDSGGCNAYDTIILIKDTCCLDKVTLTMPTSYCWNAISSLIASFNTGGNKINSYRILIHEVPAGGTWFPVYTGPYINGTPPTSINLRTYYTNFQAGKEYCISIDLFKNCTGGGTINRTVVACFKIKPRYERSQTVYFSCTDSCKEVLLPSTPTMPMTSVIAGWTNSPLGKVKTYCPTIAFTKIVVASIDSGGCTAYDTVILVKDTCCLNKACFTIPSSVCEDDANINLDFSCNQANLNSYTIEIEEIGGTIKHTRTVVTSKPPIVNLRTYWNGYECGKAYNIRIIFRKNCTTSVNTITKSFTYNCVERHAICIDVPCGSSLDLNNLPAEARLCSGPMTSYTKLLPIVSTPNTNPIVIATGTQVLKIRYTCCELILTVRTTNTIENDTIILNPSDTTFMMLPCGSGTSKFYINNILVYTGSSYTARYVAGNTYRVETTDANGCKCIRNYYIEVVSPIVCNCTTVNAAISSTINPLNIRNYNFVSASTVCPAYSNFPICHEGWEISNFPVPLSGATLPGGVSTGSTFNFTFPGPGDYQVCHYTWYCTGGVMSEECIKSTCEIITIPVERRASNSNNQIEIVADNLEDGIIVYPNPFSDNIQIDFTLNINSDIHIEIIDMNGKTVKEENILHALKGANKYQINLESLADGLFIIKMTGNNFNATQKINHIK